MTSINKKQVKLAKKAIVEMQLRQIKNINKDSTAYYIKHLAERHIRANRIVPAHEAYISEQALTKAMIKSGFKTGLDNYGRTCFNVGAREVTKAMYLIRRANE